MSYCPEHGKLMFCRNPEAYDDVIYICPDGHTIVYTDGVYMDSTHPDCPCAFPMIFSDALALVESFQNSYGRSIVADEWFEMVRKALKIAMKASNEGEA